MPPCLCNVISLSVQQQLISFSTEHQFILCKSAELVPGNSKYWALIGPWTGKSLWRPVIGWNWPVYKQKTSYDAHLWVSSSGQRIQMFSLISRENWFYKQDTVHPVIISIWIITFISIVSASLADRRIHFNSAFTTLSYNHKLVYFKLQHTGGGLSYFSQIIIPRKVDILDQ